MAIEGGLENSGKVAKAQRMTYCPSSGIGIRNASTLFPMSNVITTISRTGSYVSTASFVVPGQRPPTCCSRSEPSYR